MAEYIDRTQIKWYGCDFEGGKACCKNQGDCSKCIHGNCDHDEVMNIPPANVVWREKIDKAIEEIVELGKEMNKVQFTKHLVPLDNILEILKRNIG